MGQNLWERGRRKVVMGRAHAETVNKGTSYTVQGRALPSQDSNAVGCFLFVMDFSKNRNYSIIPLPNQIWPLRYQTCKKISVSK